MLYQAAYAAEPGELLVATDRFRDLRALYRWKIGSDASAASFREIVAPAGMEVAKFDIDLPRPRRLEVQESPRFAAYQKAITDLFRARGVLRY